VRSLQGGSHITGNPHPRLGESEGWCARSVVSDLGRETATASRARSSMAMVSLSKFTASIPRHHDLRHNAGRAGPTQRQRAFSWAAGGWGFFEPPPRLFFGTGARAAGRARHQGQYRLEKGLAGRWRSLQTRQRLLLAGAATTCVFALRVPGSGAPLNKHDDRKTAANLLSDRSIDGEIDVGGAYSLMADLLLERLPRMRPGK
jgi:hypothetical protein